ncbi:hypothetical protein GRI34_11965 [Erythrobacter aquimaris]|uniref:PDZ domain-containing protein n=1 Tax=Qipengyuania aquimaris TaxID=255984 RepID=A0A6I4TMI8_9SPHN|nr:aspartyl protease family protein [Qipengyuania aquimaris]MXO97132.1 hypothetical protein [Qipengyuania aquimaris]
MKIDRRTFVVSAAGTAALAFSPSALKAQEAGYTVPIRLTDRRVLIDCFVDDRGPFAFVLDTGGSVGLIDEKAVQVLGLKSVGKSPLRIHGQRRKYDMMLVDSFSFGGVVKQKGALFAATDNVTFHDGAIGSLAAGTLTTLESELDFEALEWRIYPDEGPSRDGWERIENALVKGGNENGSSWLFAPVKVGDGVFPIGLDTGAPTELRLSGDALKASGMWDAPRWTPGAPDGQGRIVRLSSLSLGGATLEGVIANLNPKSQFPYFENGLVGLPILRRFHIATRPQEDALFLKRNTLPDPARNYNRAGIWLNRAGSDLEVAVVGAGSPAEKAGIRPGDRLIDADFYETIDAMHQDAGSIVSLKVRSKSGTRTIDLILEDFL